MLRILGVCLTIILSFTACKPDSLVFEIYTSDIEAAKSGEIKEAKATGQFSIMGKDKENILGQATEVVKKYLPEGSTITKSKAQFGERLVIETKYPLVTTDSWKKIKPGTRPGLIKVVTGGNQMGLVYGYSQSGVSALNKELKKINFMIDFDANEFDTLKFRIINDSKQSYQISSSSVWIKKKPHVSFKKELKNRDSIELVFKGGKASIYGKGDANPNPIVILEPKK